VVAKDSCDHARSKTLAHVGVGGVTNGSGSANVWTRPNEIESEFGIDHESGAHDPEILWGTASEENETSNGNLNEEKGGGCASPASSTAGALRLRSRVASQIGTWTCETRCAFVSGESESVSGL
jgi:hypothetical protein